MSEYSLDLQKKADFIQLTILLHDLGCYDTELQQPVSNLRDFAKKLRSTRNVFISLHNLRDASQALRLEGDNVFKDATKSLNKKLDFIAHIRNKGVGHLDQEVLRRAALWTPEMFCESSKDDEDLLVFASYKALLETSINSYLAGNSKNSHFSSEIDFLYPPNASEFFNFLSKTIDESMNWIREARKKVKNEIKFHSEDKIAEFAKHAGVTNFDLKGTSSLETNDEDVHANLLLIINELRSMGADESTLEWIVKKMA